MGRTAALLLVIKTLGWGALSLSLSTSAPVLDIAQRETYPAFWVWGGIALEQIPAHAQRLYVLQGSIRSDRQGTPFFQTQGLLPHALNKPLFLVYRLETLAWNAVLKQSILNQIHAWQNAQQPVLGIQLDFDAGTKNLQSYAHFLRQVRADFPKTYQLSITGLLDWSQHADPNALEMLADILDEVIFQTYQGKQTIPHYAQYLKSLLRVPFAFKVGIVERGQWREADEYLLKRSAYYQGAVMFLLPTISK